MGKHFESRYLLRPRTGHRHRSRVHMAAPDNYTQCLHMDATALPSARVAGDWRAPLEDDSRPVQLLARSLSFQDSFRGKLRHLESTLPLNESRNHSCRARVGGGYLTGYRLLDT